MKERKIMKKSPNDKYRAMTRLVLAVVASMMCSFSADAIVACPDPAVVTQPDGSSITLLLHGDEWFSFNTTPDGYTVIRDNDGYYKYARLEDGILVPSKVIAHTSRRTATENAWLKGVQRYLAPDRPVIDALRAPARRLHGNTGHYDYKNFRGLVILVEYNDCPFQYADPQALFNGMVNDKDYKGYMSNAVFPELIPCTGSVRDYFYASSAGEFDPKFDVVGPVKIDYSQYDANKTSGAQTLVTAALRAADPLVNFADFDRDGNKSVDMVFFIFSGGGSNFSGNDQRLIWPHASSITSLYLDGVGFGRYACSTELYGRPESKTIDGIGTMCHEFSHVLGIADLYDTDGTGSGGSSVTPNNWSLMAHGSYLNQSRTPCLYSVYERYAAGFITPQSLSRKGHYKLDPITRANNGFRLDSNVEDEYFLLENRTRTGWDAYLPGQGMLVWRVDSTDTNVWENNKVNCNPAHSYYQLMRAGGQTADSGSDPFPGTAGITSIDNTTSPSLCSWTGRKSNYGLHNIAMNSDSTVTFDLSVVRYESHVEDFETMEPTTGDVSAAPGHELKWTLTAGALVAPTASVANGGNGTQACAMLRSSELMSSALPWESQALSFDFYNPSTTTAVVRVFYRSKPTASWIALPDGNGLTNISVSGGKTVHFESNQVLPAGVQLRIQEYSGNRTVYCYVDDITFTVEAPDSSIPGDLNDDGCVDIADLNMIINSILHSTQLPQGDLNGDGSIDVADVNTIINMILVN